MRGGRNKFGPMYKRDRARKLQVGERFVLSQCQQPLQVLRQRQLSQGLLPPQGGVYGNAQPANNNSNSSNSRTPQRACSGRSPPARQPPSSTTISTTRTILTLSISHPAPPEVYYHPPPQARYKGRCLQLFGNSSRPWMTKSGKVPCLPCYRIRHLTRLRLIYSS